MRTWKILDRGEVPEPATKALMTCVSCGTEASIPVVGMAIAQVGQGLVFDRGTYHMPHVIQCRTCRKVMELD